MVEANKIQPILIHGRNELSSSHEKDEDEVVVKDDDEDDQYCEILKNAQGNGKHGIAKAENMGVPDYIADVDDDERDGDFTM